MRIHDVLLGQLVDARLPSPWHVGVVFLVLPFTRVGVLPGILQNLRTQILVGTNGASPLGIDGCFMLPLVLVFDVRLFGSAHQVDVLAYLQLVFGLVQSLGLWRLALGVTHDGIIELHLVRCLHVNLNHLLVCLIQLGIDVQAWSLEIGGSGILKAGSGNILVGRPSCSIV